MRTEQLLTKAAKSLKDVDEGIACAGTALESKTYKVGGKAFLFVSAKVARLKLAQSVDEARAFAREPNSAIDVGAGGWTAIRWTDGDVPADAVLRRWVTESHAQYRESAAPAARKKHAFGAKPIKTKSRRT